MSIEEPFQISVSDDAIALLRRKLEDTRFPDEVEDAGWAYGAPLADVKRLTERWKNGFDWRAQERELNTLPMFTRDIEVEGFGTLNVHYVHKRSSVEGAIPLLFVHGCTPLLSVWFLVPLILPTGPGSFVEVTKLLPLLTAALPDHPSFHVVAPSLPGYAWSEAILKKGVQGKNYAELFNNLMLSLGYTEYVTQGGDWGRLITLTTASIYGPKHVKASHTNAPAAEPLTFGQNPFRYIKHLITPYSAQEAQAVANSARFRQVGAGYFLEHSTKPQTIGYSLADSPVGLLAWIYEKLVSWTDGYPWTDDEVLTWISIYWFSRSGPAASIRIYYELIRSNESLRFPKTSVPIGISFFPKEILRSPRALLYAKANIVFESEHEVGGHFAAWEQPEALAGDLRRMFGKSGPAANVVSGRSGY
ncbi:Alpha/Beta hydrolase protein [Gloeopeniophorella convolvens]|nr:Alpha/Beta hydrolase protein [Gloeopeniophorella convolvens]